MNQEIGNWGGGQPEWPTKPESAERFGLPAASNGSGTGSQEGVDAERFTVLVSCPGCGSAIETMRAGMRWCANCRRAIAVDDGGQVRVGEVLGEGALGDLFCTEEDVAVLYEQGDEWDPGADPSLRADFGVEEAWEVDTDLLAEIDEDLNRFTRPDGC